jgi:hypothetical protein
MEPNPIPPTCSVCHQPVLATYYFCPNCGNNLNQAPLSTSLWSQVSLYAFSLILPMILFLFVTKWPGVKYLRSEDKKTKNIGIIACTILAVSTILTIWLAYVWTQSAIQSSVNSINTDMSAD